MKVGTHSRLRSESVEDIHGRTDDQADLALDEIPHLLFVFYDLFVVPYLQFVQFVYLFL